MGTLDWSSAALAYRYAMLNSVKGTPKETLSSLKQFLYAMADSPLVGEDLSRKIRYFEVEKSYKDKDEEKEIIPVWRNKRPHDVMFTTYQGNEIFSWANWYDPYVGIEFAGSGVFSDLKPTRLRKIGPGWGTRDELDVFFALVEKKGALPFSEALPGFIEKTGLSEPEASLAISDWGSSRITKKKMTAGVFQWASQMKYLQSKDVLEFFTDLLLNGPMEDLWNPSKFEDRLVITWLDGAKVVHQLEPGFVTLFTKQAGCGVGTLREIANPEVSRRLNQARDWEWDDGYRDKEEKVSDQSSGYRFSCEERELPSDFIEAIGFSMHFAQVGSVIHQGIASVLEKLRERMAHPKYLYEIDSLWEESDEKLLDELKKMIKGKPKNVASDNEDEVHGSKGVYYSKSSWSTDFYANWGAIKDNHPVVEKLLVRSRAPNVKEAKFVFGESVDIIIERVSNTGVPDGAFEANPFYSVPKIVEWVSKANKISVDAAVLYLQIASLPFPSDANIRLWNDWTKKQHDTAIADLAKTDLIVVAKRARSSRTIFIPGPWEPKTWTKPIEGWKFRHLDLLNEDDEYEFSNVLRIPPHLLFERVLARIEGEDGPGFKEAPKTGKKR